MFFTALTFFTALSIEGLATIVSVIGLSILFGANPIIIALAISLDLGKVVVVSLLYKHWERLSFLMRSYALTAAATTMLITSAGAFSYLSGEFQKAIMGSQEGSLKVDVLKKQQLKYEERKRQIDDQIAKLPEKTTVQQRLKLMNGFKAEQQELQAKITEIDKGLPDLQIKQISVEAKAGPILAIAKTFAMPVEEAMKYIILLIIFVFDPLAVFLVIAGNFLLDQRRPKPTPVTELKQTKEPDPVDPVDPEGTAVDPEATAVDPVDPVDPVEPVDPETQEIVEPIAEVIPEQSVAREEITLEKLQPSTRKLEKLKPIRSSLTDVRTDRV